jgi:hypothetical protein
MARIIRSVATTSSFDRNKPWFDCVVEVRLDDNSFAADSKLGEFQPDREFAGDRTRSPHFTVMTGGFASEGDGDEKSSFPFLRMLVSLDPQQLEDRLASESPPRFHCRPNNGCNSPGEECKLVRWVFFLQFAIAAPRILWFTPTGP